MIKHRRVQARGGQLFGQVESKHCVQVWHHRESYITVGTSGSSRPEADGRIHLEITVFQPAEGDGFRAGVALSGKISQIGCRREWAPAACIGEAQHHYVGPSLCEHLSQRRTRLASYRRANAGECHVQVQLCQHRQVTMQRFCA